MMKNAFLQIYSLDLQKVINEIKSYKNEADLWIVNDKIPNSAGNLALHLTGNINHFIGAVLGNTNYKRKRDEEFSDKNKSREEIVAGLEECIVIVNDVFGNLSEDSLLTDYPEEFGGEVRQTGTILLYMLSHLNYHLGQINYHRRLLAK
jgi:hypothetical protein